MTSRHDGEPSIDFRVGHDFANAVLYSLSDHPDAERTARGIIIPIAEDVWQKVFERVFPEDYDGQNMQGLAAYCSYFRLGKHGIGYDRKRKRDFARGTRVVAKDRGKWGLDVTDDPSRAVWPSQNSLVQATEVIRGAMEYMQAHHPDWPQARIRLAHIAENSTQNEDDALDEIIRDPIRREMLIEAFERNARWARLARKLYGFACMVFDCRFELIKDDGERYIEVHHIKPMCEGGSPNDLKNLSVLCPNHHREAHYAKSSRCKELATLIRAEQRRRLARGPY